MQQPELGKRITALRKEKNLTQEELVAKSHVSVRTIQRIEAGEVLPRMVTVKILLEALGENYESFSTKKSQEMETLKSILPTTNRNTVLMAVVAGAVYLISEIILATMDISWLSENSNWGFWTNLIYISLTIVMVTAFALFVRGFVALSEVFENSLLKIACYLMALGMFGKGTLDIISLMIGDIDRLMIAYAGVAVLLGALGIVFGAGLLRLQDGMGELARVAGILEIIMGCLLITVVLFFISYVILVPAVVVEILVLYRGYEYLSKSPDSIPAV